MRVVWQGSINFTNINATCKNTNSTTQETKLRQANSVNLDGYIIFKKNRVGLGAVKQDLEPVLISDGGVENKILVVQANLLNQEIRIINAYGPQEDEIEKSLSFCQHLEGETISARDENCLTLNNSA